MALCYHKEAFTLGILISMLIVGVGFWFEGVIESMLERIGKILR